MFEEFLRSGKVRKAVPDLALTKSLLAMSVKQLTFARSNRITEESASSLFVIYYESLREICEAICAKQGYKVYNHEAFTAYLKEVLHEERASEVFDRLRKLRNRINYYGQQVSKEETHASAEDVTKLREELIKKHLADMG